MALPRTASPAPVSRAASSAAPCFLDGCFWRKVATHGLSESDGPLAVDADMMMSD
jgi:hypothetical protein